VGAGKAGTELGDWIVKRAHRLGFSLVGFAPAGPSRAAARYRVWLERGYHGHMAYLARPEAVARRQDVNQVLPGVQTVVALAANYYTTSPPAELGEDPAWGLISRYAWGDDYHDLLTDRLRQLGAAIEDQVGGAVAWRAYVDTGPLLEREWAARAGLGFVGRNTHLIHPRGGSWLFLGELLLTVVVDPPPEASPSPASGSCGTCTRCLEACPTGALVAPHVLDARRCISYLTIELKGSIPADLRPMIGNRIFGCDICQDVCPWNRRFAQPSSEAAFQPRPENAAPSLLDLMALDEEGFRRRFRGSPIRRAKRRGLLRNVAVALGNWGDRAAIPALAHALSDPEPLVRGHAAWALGRIGGPTARRHLDRALEEETDGWVRSEIEAALRE